MIRRKEFGFLSEVWVLVFVEQDREVSFGFFILGYLSYYVLWFFYCSSLVCILINKVIVIFYVFFVNINREI